MIQVTTPGQAAQYIIDMATLPHQIDYISPLYKSLLVKADELIISLPLKRRIAWHTYINKKIDAYYSPTFKSDDGNCYSQASLDAMF